MDKQPLNTGEQKDMTEFFTDLITKMEEMSQELVRVLKKITASPISQPAGSQMFVCRRKTQ